MTGDMGDDSSVRVALRVRPQLAKERIDMCQVCTQVSPSDNQLVLGKDKAFTYDYVFDIDTCQETIYDGCSRPLIEGCFEGYNATIFAYGQTGSGKTYTMGTGFDVNLTPIEVGIIPRAVEHLFNGIDERRRQAQERGEPPPDFKVNAQFMELYNEEVLDLLDTTRDPSDRGRKSHIKIHEDATGGIYCVGVTTRPVASMQDTMQCLSIGALSRTTASTNMNAQSSRSHAIFTLHIKQQRVVKDPVDAEEEEEGKERDTTEVLNEFETLSAKFHFVDLAGSERLKRTGATGDRAKEGISINCGLLALGNVISALGDKLKKGSHVPYRDSKLTRLLQDSLGGNSRTVMIACVSPSDRDFMETLNTLKYANRARNIKNKLSVNQDKTSKQMAVLRHEIQELQLELMEYKTGKRVVGSDGVEEINDMFHENTMLQAENDKLRLRIKALQETVDGLTKRNTELIAHKDALHVANIGGEDAENEVQTLIEKYVAEIEELRAKLMESEAMFEAIKRSHQRTPTRLAMSPMTSNMTSLTSSSLTAASIEFNMSPSNHISDILAEAKREVAGERKKVKKKVRARKRSQSSDKENASDEEKPDADSGGEEEEEEEEDEEGGPASEDEAAGEEDGDEEDAEDEEEEEVESGSDSDDDSENLHEDLADLTCEISIKQKLIEELELSQRRLHTMKSQYEEKLVSLQSRIRATEVERDRVLSTMGSVESHSQDNSKKVKDQYEKKLNDMQSDLRKLQAAKKEHAKLLRNQSHYEKQLKTLQKDLGDMRKIKVKLMNQIKEDSSKNRQAELRRTREVAQLRKEHLRKDNAIRSLETDKRHRELVLRRKQEEVEALRKRQKAQMSAKVSGRVGKYDKRATVPVDPMAAARRRKKAFSPKAAKARWDTLEKSVSSVVVKKQTLSHMEKDMERWIKQRENLSKKMEKFLRKKNKAAAEGENETLVRDLTDQIESLRDNIAYVQENINECQSNVMQMEEESKDDELEPSTMFTDVSLEEARYLLEHFVGLAINKGMLACQKDAESKELQAKLHQERMDSTFQRDMLQYLIQDKVDIEIDDSLMGTREDSDSDSESGSGTTSPVDSDLTKVTPSLLSPTALNKMLTNLMQQDGVTLPGMGGGVHPSGLLLGAAAGAGAPTLLNTLASQGAGDSVNTSTSSIMGGRRDKARKKTATPLDMLGGPGPGEALASPVTPLTPLGPITPTSSLGPVLEEGKGKPHPGPTPPLPSPSEGSAMPPPKTLPPRYRQNGPTVPASLPKPESSGPGRPSPSPSPSVSRKHPPPGAGTGGAAGGSGSTSAQSKPPPEPSPAMRRKTTNSSSTSSVNSLSRQSSVSDNTVTTPPGSPTSNRRNRSNNVFSRLTSNTQPASPHPTRGVISESGSRAYKTSPLIHSHTAMGHTKAVLSVFATEDILLSSSKDRTCKVWDLETQMEVMTLGGHPNNVTSVKYSEETGLAFTVSTYFIKVWDLHSGKCIKTLTSAGLTHDGAISIQTSSRQVTCPPGEMNINDVALNSTGSVLYSAASNTVRLWDMRSFKSVGKLSGGHQSAVMVLSVDDTDTADGNICVVTGSKDHYIKVFEVSEDSVGVLCPKYNLEPPHYDGIQSLCLMGDLLFSGSRDTCIKKWDLAEQQLKQSINGAHKDWITGLTFMPGGNCLLSGCRGGYLKLWHIDNCSPLGEIKAHATTINSITTNSNLIFTASSETGIKFWRPDWENMPSSVQEFYI